MGKQMPRKSVKKELLDLALSQNTEFFHPYLENQPSYVSILRRRMIQALDIENIPDAKKLLAEFKALPGFDNGVNRQFILSQEARLMMLLGRPAEGIVPMVLEAIGITYDKFDEAKLENIVWFGEETGLLYTLAHLRARMGDLWAAIRIGKSVCEDLIKQPPDDQESANQLLRMLYSLSNFQLTAGDFAGAAEACEVGYAASFVRIFGGHIPDFLYNNALALHGLGRTGECLPFLKKAFFGYGIMGRAERARKVHEAAEKEFGISFETYGVENMAYPARLEGGYTWGDIPQECNSIGSLLEAVVIKPRLNQSDLCFGICSNAQFSKIISGTQDGRLEHLEAIFQRLGRTIALYQNFYLRADEFEARFQREEVICLMKTGQFAKAKVKIAELGEKKFFMKGANLQFIKTAEATFFGLENGYTPEYLKRLENALNIRHGFKADEIEWYYLTQDEVVLINQIACFHGETGNVALAEKMLGQLCRNVKRRCTDKTEKAKIYGTIMYNYSKYLGQLGQRHRALEVIEEAVEHELGHGIFRRLSDLIYNRAYSLYHLGKYEESIPYWALAYYGEAIMADHSDSNSLLLTNKHAKEYFDIDFS